MIELLTGIPGSGKTFYLVSKLCTDMKFIKRYNIIVHNIEGLKNELLYENIRFKVSNSSNIFKQIPLKIFRHEFVNIEYSHVYFVDSLLFRLYPEYNPRLDRVLFIIDECHREPGLHNNYGKSSRELIKQQSIGEFFSYHRHFGFDFILCCQNISLLNKQIKPLIEMEINALAVNWLPIKMFMYKVYVNGMSIKTFTLKPQRYIYNFYQSSLLHIENKKYYSLFVGVTIAVLIFLIMLIWLLNNFSEMGLFK